MAKGYDANQARLVALSLLGKDLARRAKSKCELSRESGVSLMTYEIEPAPSEPDINKCLLVSESVLQQIQNPRSIVGSAWRGILTDLIWSESPAQLAMAHRLLSHIAQKEAWAQDVLDEAILDDETVAWAESAPLGK